MTRALSIVGALVLALGMSGVAAAQELPLPSNEVTAVEAVQEPAPVPDPTDGTDELEAALEVPEGTAVEPSPAPTRAARAVTPFAATSTTMEVIVRKRVIASPSGATSSVTANIGSNYAYTQGAVFRLYTNVSGAPGAAVTASWATCTVAAGAGQCVITIPNANSSNGGQRYWVVEEAPVAGSPAASAYANPDLYVGDYTNPTDRRRLVGLTQSVAGNRTNYLPMTASGVSGGTVLSNSELPGTDTPTVATGGSFGAVVNSLKNPAITPRCAPDTPRIALVIDESSSISASDWTTFRDALVGSGPDSVLGAMVDKASVSILGFGQGSYWHYGQNGPVAVTAQNRDAIADSVPDRSPARQGTNWDAALSTIAGVNGAHKYDLVLMATDGAPNYILGGVNSAGVNINNYNVTLRAIEAAIYAANDLKSAGTRTVTVGFGAGATDSRVERNIRAISGETKGSDYFQGSWDQVQDLMTEVVKSATCAVPITVSKTTIEDATTTSDVAGWDFAAAKQGSATLTGATTQTTKAGATGRAAWDLRFTQPTGQATSITLTETLKAEWVLDSAKCTVGGVDRPVTIAQGNQITINGLTAGSGSVACTFTNRHQPLPVDPPPGGLLILKAFDESVPAGSGDITFTGTYRCTVTEDSVASGTWSVKGAGTAQLTPAAGSPAANAIPAGASCAVTEQQPADSTGLPGSSWKWGTPIVGDPATIVSDASVTVTVTNRAERVYGNFQITKTVPAGSTADPSNSYSGAWSCTLGSETRTGTWGPMAAGGVWTSGTGQRIPLGATCKVTSEDRPEFPVAADRSHVWDGDPDLGSSVVSKASNLATVTVSNPTVRNLGEVSWEKVDQGGVTLSGSQWQVTGPGGSSTVVDCTASSCTGPDQDPTAGHFTLTDLLWGDYQLTETKAPAGYYRLADPIAFTVGAEDLDLSLGPITNTQVEGPVIPMTGGLGREFFPIAGLAVLGVGAIAAAAARRASRHQGDI